MKKFLIKILRFLIILFLISVGLSIFIKSQIFDEILPKKEIEQTKQKFQELKKQIIPSFPQIGEKVDKIPEDGLKAIVEIESKTDSKNYFSASIILKENEFYWKINPQTLTKNSNFLNFIFEWRKHSVKNEEKKELQRLIEILKSKEIFEKFERKNEQYEIEINVENLKRGVQEWKEEMKSEEIEKFFKNLGNIKGKIFINDENMIKNIELESENNRVILKIENFDKEILEKEESSLEKIFCSILKIQ